MDEPMRLFRKRGIWHVELSRNVRRSLRTTDWDEARELYRAMKEEALKGRLRDITGETAKTFKEWKKEFVSWSKEVHPHSTYRANRLALDKILEQAGEKAKLSRLSSKHMDMMVRDCKRKGLSTASINNYIRHARSCLSKAVEWGELRTNPFASCRELSAEKRPPSFISKDQVTHFLSSIKDHQLRTLAAAYLATGRRRAELLQLTWEDVDFAKNKYLVRRSKTHLSRYYPISPAFKSILESIGPDTGRIWKRWSHPDSVSKLIKGALRDAGLGGLRLHDLRHSFAVAYIEAGGDMRTLQELLGHTEYRTTEIYAHVSDDHLQQEIGRVMWGPFDLEK